MDHPYPESGYYVVDVFGSSVSMSFRRTRDITPVSQQKKASARSPAGE
jgi:hypothetical protein